MTGTLTITRLAVVTQAYKAESGVYECVSSPHIKFTYPQMESQALTRAILRVSKMHIRPLRSPPSQHQLNHNLNRSEQPSL
jgi:hypothetical protein